MSSSDEEGDVDYVPPDGADEVEEEGTAAVEEPVVVRDVEEEGRRKRKVDDLWAEMNKPAAAPKKITPGWGAILSAGTSSAPPSVVAGGTVGGGQQPDTFKAAPAVVAPDAAAAAAAAIAKMRSAAAQSHSSPSRECAATDSAPTKTGDLSGLLATLKGKSGTTMSKSREDWKFLKEKEKTVDELDAYKKDKNRYTEKVDFLRRAELLEHEKEKERKSSRRG